MSSTLLIVTRTNLFKGNDVKIEVIILSNQNQC